MLLEKGVEESRILFLTVIAAPQGIRRICGAYPRLRVLTSEIDEGMEDFHVVPGGRDVAGGCPGGWEEWMGGVEWRRMRQRPGCEGRAASPNVGAACPA